jgi:hypothetical protein
VCKIVNEGWRVAMSMEPLRYLKAISVEDNHSFRGTHPMAKVLQSAAGANAVMGSKIVLAERCSDVEGSKRMMFP